MFSFNLFGKKPQKKESTSTPDTSKTIDVISKLRGQLDSLEKRNVHIETKVKNVVIEIKKVATIDKKKALVLLNRKKTYEEEINKNLGIIDVIERQIVSLENASINQQVFKTMQEGNQFIKNANSNVDMDKMENLLEEIDEQKDTSQAISDIFRQRIDRIYEDEDLLSELNEYTQQKEVEKSTIDYHLPQVPDNQNIIVSNQNEEETELLRRLAASL